MKKIFFYSILAFSFHSCIPLNKDEAGNRTRFEFDQRSRFPLPLTQQYSSVSSSDTVIDQICFTDKLIQDEASKISMRSISLNDTIREDENAFQSQKPRDAFSRIVLKKLNTNDHHVLLVIFFLGLGLGLLLWGGAILIIGIYSLNFLMSLVGLAILLLGVLPIIGVINMVVGEKFRPRYSEE